MEEQGWVRVRVRTRPVPARVVLLPALVRGRGRVQVQVLVRNRDRVRSLDRVRVVRAGTPPARVVLAQVQERNLLAQEPIEGEKQTQVIVLQEKELSLRWPS